MAWAIDRARLADWLWRNVGRFTGELTIEQCQGGQSNPTYLVTAGERRFVLRRKPSGDLLPSAHAIDREYRVMRALAGSDVPVPDMIAFCDDASIIGTDFFVMEWIDGRVLWDPSLPGMTPVSRAAHYDEMNRVIAALHNVDYRAIGLGDFGKPGNYLARQVARWSKQYASAVAERIEAMDKLIEWLPANIPPRDEQAIVHGDYRVDNVLFHPSEAKILAVVDWELSTIGHPLSDFAYHVMVWRLTPQQFRGLHGLDLQRLGVPPEDAYVRTYCERTGRDSIDGWDIYLIFNMFRIAAILHGVLSRALQGNAASADAIETGGRAERVANVAWNMAQAISRR